MSISSAKIAMMAPAGAGGAFPIQEVFSSSLYTGNNTSQTITNGIDLANEGGMVWLKARNITENNGVFDTARGAGYYLVTNNTAINAFTSGVSFNNNGFTVGSSFNAFSGSYVSWTFRKAAEFFDIQTYVAATSNTVSHNLTTTPEMMFVKNYSGVTNAWLVYHKSVGLNKYLLLYNTDAQATGSWSFQSVTPTTFRTGYAYPPGDNLIAYLFGTIAGSTKVGSYTGNGSIQTIDCGFSTGAQFILIKRTDSAGSWYIWDTARGIVAANDPHLSPNSNAQETTNNDSIDADSSGFIVNQYPVTNINVSGATYIYYAIASAA